MSHNNIVTCPHCSDKIEIIEINCAIFRHGVYKNTGIQINPHAGEKECDDLVEKQEIYGCGKPFKIMKTPHSEILEAIICDYI